jgi:hypothetical protein
MSLAGFEPTIPVFKRAKTFHALDRVATVTGARKTTLLLKTSRNEHMLLAALAHLVEGVDLTLLLTLNMESRNEFSVYTKTN